jgi:hypothetical protein
MSVHIQNPARPAIADLIPARLCVGSQARADKLAHVILGVSADGDVGVAGALVGEWLANVFGQAFTENRAGDSSLAVEALYDALARSIGGGIFVGAIGMAVEHESPPARPHAQRPAQPGRSQIIHETEAIALRFQGFAHALFDRASGWAMTTFDHLPGAVELVGRPVPGRSMRSDPEAGRAEATAWYGFGTLMRRQAGMRDLHDGISHSIIDAELRSPLAEHVQDRH